MNSKTIITLGGLLLSICGWFVWNFAIGAIFPSHLEIYQVHDTFLQNFGRTLNYWATMVLLLLTLISVELFWGAVRRVYFPNNTDRMQRAEKDPGAMRNYDEYFEELRGERAGSADDDDDNNKAAAEKRSTSAKVTPAASPGGPWARNSEQAARGKRGRRPSGEYARQSVVEPVLEEGTGHGPYGDASRARNDGWV
jgi:hypothetical protein